MKLSFDLPATEERACKIFLIWIFVFASGCMNMQMQYMVGDVRKSILRSNGFNVKSLSSVNLCGYSYNDCLCSSLSNKSIDAQNCVSYYPILASHILPFITFVSLIFFLRDLFKFSSDTPHFIRSILWIICAVIFIGMIIGIYLNNCYHVLIIQILHGINCLMLLVMCYWVKICFERSRSRTVQKEVRNIGTSTMSVDNLFILSNVNENVKRSKVNVCRDWQDIV